MPADDILERHNQASKGFEDLVMQYLKQTETNMTRLETVTQALRDEMRLGLNSQAMAQSQISASNGERMVKIEMRLSQALDETTNFKTVSNDVASLKQTVADLKAASEAKNEGNKWLWGVAISVLIFLWDIIKDTVLKH